MKTVNQVKNSYTYYLEPNLGKIWFLVKNDEITLEAMKAIVKNYIKPAKYSYDGGKLTKKDWFQKELDKIETKKQVYLLCKNSVRKAKETIAR